MAESTQKNETNQNNIRKIQLAIQESLRQILNRGYYGNANLRIAVQDGVIQNIQYSLERSVR
ncbi:MAG: hypothetical protein Q4D98_02375 [Planctomycetia bacterium]|nr:hypothetical protein [Planctomycetia bacterium]